MKRPNPVVRRARRRGLYEDATYLSESSTEAAMAHRREPEEPGNRRARAWAVAVVVVLALGMAVYLAWTVRW